MNKYGIIRVEHFKLTGKILTVNHAGFSTLAEAQAIAHGILAMPDTGRSDIAIICYDENKDIKLLDTISEDEVMVIPL